MATVPTPYDWTAGVAPTAAQLNAGVRDVDAFLLSQPRCSLYQSSGGSPANATWTRVVWDSASIDNDTMMGTGPAAGRLIFKTPGVYLLAATMFWAPHATGQRGLNLTRNGAGVRSASNVVLSDGAILAAGTGADTRHSATVIRSFSVNDYIEAWVYQNSGGVLTLRGGTNGSVLQAIRLSS